MVKKAWEDIMLQFAAEVGDASLSASKRWV